MEGQLLLDFLKSLRRGINMSKRLCAIAALLLTYLPTAHADQFPNQQLKRPLLIASYSGRDASQPGMPGIGVMECGSLSSPSRLHFDKVEMAYVYYYAEFPTRIWVSVEGGNHAGDYLLGDSESCWFRMTRSSPLP
jgi:hypothetical protein